MEEYIVQPGDTLFSIARLFQVPTDHLRSINPETGDTGEVFVGQALRVPLTGQVRPTIEVNAFTFPVDDPLQWSAIFPYLTYLSIFGYEILPGGFLTSLDDAQLVLVARQAGVAPLMVVTNTVEDVYSSELLHGILSDLTAQQTLIDNCIAVTQANGYYGVNFRFQNIFPEDYMSYASFLELAANRLHALGLIIVISIPLGRVLENISSPAGLSLFNRVLDRIIMTVGDFSCTEEQVPIDNIQQGLDNVSKLFTKRKMLLGVPSCCFEWEEPFSPNNGYHALSTDQAATLVRLTGADLEIDPYTKKTFFRIQEDGKPLRLLICDPVRSLAVLELVKIYSMGGISFRTLDLYGFGSFQTIKVYNDISKTLPLTDING